MQESVLFLSVASLKNRHVFRTRINYSSSVSSQSPAATKAFTGAVSVCTIFLPDSLSKFILINLIIHVSFITPHNRGNTNGQETIRHFDFPYFHLIHSGGLVLFPEIARSVFRAYFFVATHRFPLFVRCLYFSLSLLRSADACERA